MAGLLTETQARQAFTAAPLRWRGWGCSGFLAVPAFLGGFGTFGVTERPLLGWAVALSILTILGVPFLLLWQRARGRVAEDNVVRRVVPGRVAQVRTSRYVQRLVVDLADGAQLSLSTNRPFGDPTLAPGQEVWAADPDTGRRVRLACCGRGGYPVVLQPSGAAWVVPPPQHAAPGVAP